MCLYLSLPITMSASAHVMVSGSTESITLTMALEGQLDDLAPKQHIQQPVEDDADPLAQQRHLGQVDPPPEGPGHQTGEGHTIEAGHRGAPADEGELADRRGHQGPRRRALPHCPDAVGDPRPFAPRALRRRGARRPPPRPRAPATGPP